MVIGGLVLDYQVVDGGMVDWTGSALAVME